jgi:hypothetical protein
MHSGNQTFQVRVRRHVTSIQFNNKDISINFSTGEDETRTPTAEEVRAKRNEEIQRRIEAMRENDVEEVLYQK